MTEPDFKKIKRISIKACLPDKKFEDILVYVNFRAPYLLNPKLEKLIVVVNGKETELKL